METNKSYWWRYPIAVVVFALLFVFAPALLMLFFKIGELFVPAYMESNAPVWTWCLAYAFGAYLTAEAAEQILVDKDVFVGILCVIAAVYRIFVGAWNLATGYNTLSLSIPVLLGGIVFIVVAIDYFVADHKRRG